MKPKTHRAFILALASVAAIGLVFIMLAGRNLPQINGSLSKDDARAILKEFNHFRWRAAYKPLSRREFRLFWRRIESENFKVRPVTIEGDSTQAVVKCRDRLDRVSVIWHFEKKGGGWSLTNVSGGRSLTNLSHIKRITSGELRYDDAP